MRRNGTGPRGRGPMTGRGLGNCTRSADSERTEDEAGDFLRSVGFNGPGRTRRGQGRGGFGGGMGRGLGRGRAQGQGRGQGGQGGFGNGYGSRGGFR